MSEVYRRYARPNYAAVVEELLWLALDAGCDLAVAADPVLARYDLRYDYCLLPEGGQPPPGRKWVVHRIEGRTPTAMALWV